MDEREVPDQRTLRQFRRQLLRWYASHGRTFPWRKLRATVYAKVVSEILLQRTRAEAVDAIYSRFFGLFPNWGELAKASLEELQEVLRPLGLWRRRAANLTALAALIAPIGRLPRGRLEVERLPGVGQYVANAIMLFANKGRTPLVDVNMARVLERCFGRRKLVDIRYDPYLQHLSHAVVDCDSAAAVNWAILDIAAIYCKVFRPKCRQCPARGICSFARDQGRSNLVPRAKDR